MTLTSRNVSKSDLSPILMTKSGPLRGLIVNDEDVSYYSYRGIPYAEPPVGNLRFMSPQPKCPWKETFNATEFGPVCPQKPGIYPLEEMSEDCLTLNIFVPKTTAEQPFSVLVETHSSEFRKRSARDDVFAPLFFMQCGVILVTYQYRFGALGFLSVQTDEAPGNAGLKDALLALKWVKENIAQFGGDSNNITIGGNSSGAVMVHYFLLSEQCTGLFNRAILRSGSALGYRFLDRYPVETALALGSELGFQSDDIHDLIQYLRQVDVFDIVKITINMEAKDKLQGTRPFSPFMPVVEPVSDNAFITRDPLEIIKCAIPQNVPVIVGFNSQEGLGMIPTLRTNTAVLEYLNGDFELCIPTDIEYPHGSVESVSLAKLIKDFYFNGDQLSIATIQNYVTLLTDTQFSFAIDRWIQTHKSKSTIPIYYYVFDFDGDLNFFKVNYDVKGFKGAAHVDDFGYMFATASTRPLLAGASAASLQMKEIIMTLNTNFVKYGTPTPSPQLTKKVTLKWSDYAKERSYLSLTDQPQMLQGSPIQERLDFWYKVYEDYEKYLQNGGVVQAKRML